MTGQLGPRLGRGKPLGILGLWVAVAGAAGLACAFAVGAAAQEPDRKIYVPNFTGDISEKMGELIAAKVRATLVERGIQAFTYRNLADQLKQEETKSKLRCDDETSCVEELVSSFGLAERVFGHVTLLKPGEYSIDLTWMVKSKTKGSKVEIVKCEEMELPGISGKLVAEMLGNKGHPEPPDSPDDEGGGGGGEEWTPESSGKVIVEFVSVPGGAVVLVDGDLVCQDTYRKCSRALAPGPHRVAMQKERYIKREEMLSLREDMAVKWELQPDFGWLTVRSSPPGLPVQLDGKSVGVTPLEGADLAPGAHTVLVRDRCFEEEERRLVLDRGEKEVIDLTMKPVNGAVDVTAVDGEGNALRAEVVVDVPQEPPAAPPGASATGRAAPHRPWAALAGFGQRALELRDSLNPAVVLRWLDRKR